MMSVMTMFQQQRPSFSHFSLTPTPSRRRIRRNRLSEEQFPSFGMQHPLRRLVTHPGLAAELNRKSRARSFAEKGGVIESAFLSN
jgi:hypothetical protein